MKTKLKKWLQSYCAVVMYKIGKTPSCSTFIDEVSIPAGYGKLNDVGSFKYDLPKRYVRKLFKGCTNWNDYLDKCE